MDGSTSAKDANNADKLHRVASWRKIEELYYGLFDASRRHSEHDRMLLSPVFLHFLGPRSVACFFPH